MREAKYYESSNNLVICRLCPHGCKIPISKVGKCGVRKNIDNKLFSLNYGKLSAINIDPIEKKPIYHFLEKTSTLSLGSYGCNLTCYYCQNYHISKEVPSTIERTPGEIVELALEYKLPSISYTYNEPTVFYEYVLEVAQLAKAKDLKNILVTNGYIEEEALKELLQYIDAINIDLKAFRNDVYKSFCGGELEPVKKSIQLASQYCHVEVTSLIVPEMNDDLHQLSELFQWLASLDRKIPLHLSRYYPRYKYHKPPTDIGFMEEVKHEAKKYLLNVHLGNV